VAVLDMRFIGMTRFLGLFLVLDIVVCYNQSARTKKGLNMFRANVKQFQTHKL